MGGGEAAVGGAPFQVEGDQTFPATDPEMAGCVQARADASAGLFFEGGCQRARMEIIKEDAAVGSNPEQAAVRIVVQGADEVQAGVTRQEVLQHPVGFPGGDDIDAAAPGSDQHPSLGKEAELAHAVVAQTAPLAGEVAESLASRFPDAQAAFHRPDPEPAVRLLEDGVHRPGGQGVRILPVISEVADG